MIVSNHLTRLTATLAKRRYERWQRSLRSGVADEYASDRLHELVITVDSPLDVRKEPHRRFKWAVVKTTPSRPRDPTNPAW